MFIKSDHKDLYLKYLRNSGYAPASIRILSSDIQSLFSWLQAFNFSVPIDHVLARYERYLILNNTPSSAASRKLSTTKKFISWYRLEYPQVQSRGSSNVHRRDPVQTVQNRRQSHIIVIPYITVFVCLVVVFMLLYQYIYRNAQFISSSVRGVVVSGKSTASILRFVLQLNSPNRLTTPNETYLLFKLYANMDINAAIGYIRCPFSGADIPKGSSRLQIDVTPECSFSSTSIRDSIDRGDAIFANVFLNSQKLNDSMIMLKNSIDDFTDSSYQYAMNNGIPNPSNYTSPVPTSYAKGDILGLGVANTPISPEIIPFSAFQNFSSFSDGDIVALYEGEVVRALLSTKVLGVVSNKSIVAQGIAYVRMIQSPDTMISSGDYIATSTQAGYGKKADNEYDYVIGVALEPLLPGNEYLKILVSLP